jgi:hypothetical protein
MLSFIQNVKKNWNTVFLHNGEWKDTFATTALPRQKSTT